MIDTTAPMKELADTLGVEMTESKAMEAFAHCEAGNMPELTVGQVRQLLQGWMEAQKLSKIAEGYEWLIDDKRGDWIWNHVLGDEDKLLGNSIQAIVEARLSQRRAAVAALKALDGNELSTT